MGVAIGSRRGKVRIKSNKMKVDVISGRFQGEKRSILGNVNEYGRIQGAWSNNWVIIFQKMYEKIIYKLEM